MNTIIHSMGSSMAGTFYPAERSELNGQLSALFSQARQEQGHKITTHFKAMILPHAGYKYSGLTSTHGYKFFNPAKFNKIVVLGPAHKKAFEGLASPSSAQYHSPLAVSPKGKIEAHTGILLSNELFEGEHSVDVHFPFIHFRLLEENIDPNTYPIIPLLYGDLSPLKLAKKLEQLIDDKTFIVLSSDLSHYHDLPTAQRKDEEAIEAILNANPKEVLNVEACGRHGISAFLQTQFARLCKPEFIHYSNSASSSGDSSRVVGYCAVGFAETLIPSNRHNGLIELSVFANPKQVIREDCQKEILELLRSCLKEFILNKKLPDYSFLGQKYPYLNEEAACFVSLKVAKNRSLRGCIGSLSPTRSLLNDMVVNVVRAATEDPRFEVLSIDELNDIKIEVSILEQPKFLRCRSEFDLLSQIEPQKHGVIVQQGNKRATFLPQVWKIFDRKSDFMAQLCKKAGLKEDAWRLPKEKVQIFVYEVMSFTE